MTNLILKLAKAPSFFLRKLQSRNNNRKLSKITDDAQHLQNKKILKVLLGPSFSVFHAMKIHDILLCSALSAKGADITYLACGYGLQACLKCGGIIQIAEAKQNLCVYCQRFERNDANLVGHLAKFCKIARPRDVLGKQKNSGLQNLVKTLPASKLKNFMYNLVPIGKYSADIVANLGYVGNLKLVDNYELRLRSTIFANLLYCSYFMEIIDRVKPDIIVSHDAFYAPWAMLHDMAKQKNITFYNYYSGLRHNTFHYVKDKIAMNLNIDDLYEKWKDKKIKASELRKLDKIFSGRKKGKIYSGKEKWMTDGEEHAHLEKMLCSKKPIAAIYGNVLWDLNALNKQAVFSSIQDTYLETVRFFMEHPEYNLIVKPHPAELNVEHESREKITDLIRQEFPNLPDNILVLKPKTDITGYFLIPNSKVTLAYTSTIGVESVILGTPTISLGRAEYRNKGFTFDPNSPGNYFQMLEKILNSNRIEDLKKARDLARKYYYLYFYVYLHDYKIIKFDLYEKTKVIPGSLHALLQNKDFSKLADSIINKDNIPYFDDELEEKYDL